MDYKFYAWFFLIATLLESGLLWSVALDLEQEKKIHHVCLTDGDIQKILQQHEMAP